jgi:quercetin dioxygenase-like cupin family protein
MVEDNAQAEIGEGMTMSQAVKAGTLFDWSKVPAKRLQDGIERQMIVGDKLMVCRLTFAPGTVTPEHDHPHEQVTMVERGRVRFVVGKDVRIMGPGEVVHLPGGVWHGATMLDEEVVLIDIFSPPREDFLAQI